MAGTVKGLLSALGVGTAAGTASEDSDATFLRAVKETVERVMKEAPDVAPNATPANLDQAIDMLKSGEREIDVFRDTGFFLGADGKLRFEIDDSGAKAIKPTRGQPGSGSIYHPAGDLIHKGNEETINIPEVQFVDHLENDVAAKYTPYSGVSPARMKLSLYQTGTRDPRPEDELLSQFLHENQHHVQNVSSLERGTNVETANRRMSKNITERKDVLRDLIKYTFDPAKKVKLLDDLDAVKAENHATRQKLKYISDFDAYHRSAGETEARTVQNRKDLSLRQRYQIHPAISEDLDRSQQLLIDRPWQTPQDPGLVRLRSKKGRELRGTPAGLAAILTGAVDVSSNESSTNPSDAPPFDDVINGRKETLGTNIALQRAITEYLQSDPMGLDVPSTEEFVPTQQLKPGHGNAISRDEHALQREMQGSSLLRLLGSAIGDSGLGPMPSENVSRFANKSGEGFTTTGKERLLAVEDLLNLL